jgi:hypothetical protein
LDEGVHVQDTTEGWVLPVVFDAFVIGHENRRGGHLDQSWYDSDEGQQGEFDLQSSLC